MKTDIKTVRARDMESICKAMEEIPELDMGTQIFTVDGIQLRYPKFVTDNDKWHAVVRKYVGLDGSRALLRRFLIAHKCPVPKSRPGTAPGSGRATPTPGAGNVSLDSAHLTELLAGLQRQLEAQAQSQVQSAPAAQPTDAQAMAAVAPTTQCEEVHDDHGAYHRAVGLPFLGGDLPDDSDVESDEGGAVMLLRESPVPQPWLFPPARRLACRKASRKHTCSVACTDQARESTFALLSDDDGGDDGGGGGGGGGDYDDDEELESEKCMASCK
ncbi:MAG: hypothetical protein AAFR44_12965, partial [Pseudomonadota bacterium]